MVQDLIVAHLVLGVDRVKVEHQAQLDKRATWEKWVSWDILVRAVVT